MVDGKCWNGQHQSFYFLKGHPWQGVLKGMTVILELFPKDDPWENREWGYNVKRACGGAKFNCPQGAADFCCQQMHFNEPDFTNVKSQLEELAESLWVEVIQLFAKISPWAKPHWTMLGFCKNDINMSSNTCAKMCLGSWTEGPLFPELAKLVEITGDEKE